MMHGPTNVKYVTDICLVRVLLQGWLRTQGVGTANFLG